MARTENRLFEPKPVGAATLDRRGAHRFAAIGTLRAVAGAASASDNGALTLSLIDESDTGAGANVNSPLPPGTRLSVLTNALEGIWRGARVVRCIPAKRGFRIGIVYDAFLRQAA